MSSPSATLPAPTIHLTPEVNDGLIRLAILLDEIAQTDPEFPAAAVAPKKKPVRRSVSAGKRK